MKVCEACKKQKSDVTEQEVLASLDVRDSKKASLVTTRSASVCSDCLKNNRHPED